MRSRLALMMVTTLLVGLLGGPGSPTGAGAATGDSSASGSTGGEVARQVSAGDAFSCLLIPKGQIWCWGDAPIGGLGFPGPKIPLENRPPLDLGSGRTAVTMATGGSHLCAILDNGELKCVGRNFSGALGLGDTTVRSDNPPPVDLGTGRTAVAVAAGEYHTCAILDNGDLKCWGENSAGQLGLGDTTDRGDNPGEMGDNLPPVDLGAGRTAVAVAASEFDTCAILDHGQMKCWGSGQSGRLGQGSTADLGDGPGEMGDNLPPIDLGRGRTVTQIAVGVAHTCALLNRGDLKCWGNNFWGPTGSELVNTIGDEPNELGDHLPRVNVEPFRTVTWITAGNLHTCVALDNGVTKCWGKGGSGQLGIRTTGITGNTPGSMGTNLPPVNVADIPAWIRCNTHEPVGYFLVGSDFRVTAFGDGTPHPDTRTRTFVGRALDIESSVSGCGYWILSSNWVLHNFGDAVDLGRVDHGIRGIGEEPSTFSVTPSGQGAWVFTNRGRVLTLGDAEPRYSGGISDLSGISLRAPIVDSVATPSGEGYYMLGSDGGVFAFGDARYAGSLPELGITPDQPLVGLVPDPDGYGYWLVAADGGVFAFGAPFRNSLPGLGVTHLDAPIVGMTAYADGYLQVAGDGGVFNFSSLPFSGSLGGRGFDIEVTAVSPVWRPR